MDAESEVKIKILPVKPENIPPELKEYDHWVCWKAKSKANGEFDKTPINAKNGANASVSDPSTWGSYARALKFYKTHKKTIAGIGFVLTKDTPFAGGDGDHCRDPETGEITEPVKKILQNFNTYSEVSPSGTGIRFFCLGELAGRGVAKDGVELYDTGRFLTVTGEHLPEYGNAIEERQEELSTLYEKLGGNNGTEGNPFGWQNDLLQGVSASERHNSAMRLGGRWAAKGFSPDEVTLFITAWNLKNNPPKPELSDPESKELRDIVHYAFAESLFGEDGPEKHIADLNEKHAVVMVGGKCCVMNETFCSVFSKKDITFSNKTDFMNFYANKKITLNGGNKPVSVAKIWWDSRDRKQYDGIVFEPGANVPPSYFNLWQGFAVEAVQGDWSLMQRLISKGIAGGIKDRFVYILNWVARIVQDPGGWRPGVSLVMRGPQGVGKGEFTKHFGSLFGPHFLQVAQGSQVVGRFNNHMKDCVVLFVDEGFWAGNKQAESVIKNLVTEPALIIEAKGKDAFSVKNNVNLIIASNNSWVVPAGLDERRFYPFDVSDHFKGNYEFFKKLNDQMKNGGREAMLYDLLERDISGVDLRDFERTDALFDQMLESMTPTQSWWFERLNKGIATDYMLFDDTEDWPGEVPNEHLYKSFVEYATKLKRFIPIHDVFSKELNKLILPVGYTRKVKGKGKRRRFRVLPSLEECRQTFEKIIGITIDWDYQEEEVPF